MNKQETYAFLRSRLGDFEVTEHPAVFNMAEVAEIELPYPEVDAKNLFVRDDKRRNYYLITVMGHKRVNLKDFRKAQGLRALSLASDEDLMQFLCLIEKIPPQTFEFIRETRRGELQKSTTTNLQCAKLAVL
ncbi:MAG: YbaK/EbsC family protein [Sutterellaceae bacterium]|nr:YbaK/EbsC family protein [Sutterellaceae bacterium]